jgi:NAD(P)-dependent dehydrogenase (short-subunit alcohol dehydrogenase family)
MAASMRLEGKRAMVTGGSGDLGRKIALRLVDEGARVVCVSRSPEVARSDRRGTDALTWDRLDARDHRSVELCFTRVMDRWGGLDILVTAAGVMHDATVGRLSDAAIDDMLLTNLGGTIRCVNAAAKIMRPARRGVILTMSSAAASVPIRGTATYAATKAGVEAFTRTAAADLAPHVRVNCLSPGFIAAGMAKPVLDHADHGPLIVDRIGLGHAGAPEDVAASALFLVSGESSYITGAVLRVDGGLR